MSPAIAGFVRWSCRSRRDPGSVTIPLECGDRARHVGQRDRPIHGGVTSGHATSHASNAASRQIRWARCPHHDRGGVGLGGEGGSLDGPRAMPRPVECGRCRVRRSRARSERDVRVRRGSFMAAWPRPEHGNVRIENGNDSGGLRKRSGGLRWNIGGLRRSSGGRRRSFRGPGKSSGWLGRSSRGLRKSSGGLRRSSRGRRTTFGGRRKSSPARPSRGQARPARGRVRSDHARGQGRERWTIREDSVAWAAFHADRHQRGTPHATRHPA